MPRPLPRPTSAEPRRSEATGSTLPWSSALLAFSALACEGSIGEAPLLDRPPELELDPPASQDAGAIPSVDLGVALDAGLILVDPFEEGAVTLGVRCGPEGPETRMVFTSERSSCEEHARVLAGDLPLGDRAVVRAPALNGPTSFDAPGEVCIDGDCRSRSIRVEIDALGPTGALGRWSVALEEQTAGGQLVATLCNYDEFLPGRDPSLAPNLAIEEVAFYQGVRVPLVRDRAEVLLRNAGVVADRPGLLRVFVAPEVGFLTETIDAELVWDPGESAEPVRLTDAVEVGQASIENRPETTFDFEIPAELVTTTARWSVALRPRRACAGVGQDTSGARFPTSETISLRAEPVGVLEVVLVPFRYNADGSAQLPDTSPEQVERYRRTLLSLFPVADVRVTVREEPVDWAAPIRPNGAGWSDFLRGLLDVRAMDNPPPNTFYYGIFRPSGTWGGGIAGLGPVPSATDVFRRGAVGLGYAGQGSANTCAHELGHATGRRHAPCGVDDPDPNYPSPDEFPEYAGGSIGTWGYDILDGRLKDPATHRDFMSYCRPEWISDYNYAAILDRLTVVNQTAPFAAAETTRWRSLALTAEGPRWGGRTFPLRTPPQGAEIRVRYRSALGERLGERVAVAFGVDHLDERIVVVPEAPPGTALIELGDGLILAY